MSYDTITCNSPNVMTSFSWWSSVLQLQPDWRSPEMPDYWDMWRPQGEFDVYQSRRTETWLEGRYWISDVIIQTKDIACSDKVCLTSTCKCFYGGCIHSFYFVSEVIASLGKARLFAIIDGLMMYGVFSFRIFFLYNKTLIFWDW